MRTLITGGSGLLGTEIQKHLSVYAPPHREFDITKFIPPSEIFELVIHSAAYTDVVAAEKKRDECYLINVQGTINMLNAFVDTPFVYISSEYANNPANYYSETKKIAEIEVQKRKGPYLIIRTLFKPNPFPFPKAFTDQYTQGDYIDIIGPMIIKEILSWDKKSQKLLYIGTGRKTIYNLAKRTRPDILPISIKEITTVTLPSDYE